MSERLVDGFKTGAGRARAKLQGRSPPLLVLLGVLALGRGAGAWAAVEAPQTVAPSLERALDADALKLVALSEVSEGKAPTGGVLGRRFSLVFALDQAMPGATSPAVWRYDPSARTLTLEFSARGALEGDGVLLDMMVRPGRQLPGGAAVANARELDADFVALPGAFERLGKLAVLRRPLSVRTFAQAEAIGKATTVELQGYVAGYASGAPNRCSLRRRDQPSAGYLVACSVGLAVTDIRFQTPQATALSGHSRLRPRLVDGPALASPIGRPASD